MINATVSSTENEATKASYILRVFGMSLMVFRFWGNFFLLTLVVKKSAAKVSKEKMTSKP